VYCQLQTGGQLPPSASAGGADSERSIQNPSNAMVMASLCPTAMLFIRCKGGVSHNPAEHVDPADAEIALRVMLGFIERMGAAHVV